MEKRVEDVEKVENKVENELKVKCPKKREQIKKQKPGKKIHMHDSCEKEVIKSQTKAKQVRMI